MKRRDLLKATAGSTTIGFAGLSAGQDGEETTTAGGQETTTQAQADCDFSPMAEDYPESGRTISYIVPFSQGGGTDTYARQILPQVGEILDVNFQIQNIPGSASLRGTGQLVQADADGYTMGAFNPPSTPLSYLVFQPDYDLSQLKGVATYARTPYVLITQADADVDSLEGVMSKYEAGDWQAIGGCQARGGLNHVASLVMQNEYGMQWENYVGYDGCAPAVQAVASGEVPATITTDVAAQGTVESNRAKIVAVLSSGGSGVFSDATPVTEQGFGNIDYIGQLTRSMWMPAGVSDGQVNKVSSAVQEALKSESVQQWSEETGNIIEFGCPSTTDELLQQTLETLPEKVDIEKIREEATS
jgi:tripartite-type tricarboxylate transporter receptor subunit TctC